VIASTIPHPGQLTRDIVITPEYISRQLKMISGLHRALSDARRSDGGVQDALDCAPITLCRENRDDGHSQLLPNQQRY
jgi:hypothetical protein